MQPLVRLAMRSDTRVIPSKPLPSYLFFLHSFIYLSMPLSTHISIKSGRNRALLLFVWGSKRQGNKEHQCWNCISLNEGSRKIKKMLLQQEIDSETKKRMNGRGCYSKGWPCKGNMKAFTLLHK